MVSQLHHVQTARLSISYFSDNEHITNNLKDKRTDFKTNQNQTEKCFIFDLTAMPTFVTLFRESKIAIHRTSAFYFILTIPVANYVMNVIFIEYVFPENDSDIFFTFN